MLISLFCNFYQCVYLCCFCLHRLHCCSGFHSSCSARGSSLAAVLELLGARGTQASVAVVQGLNAPGCKSSQTREQASRPLKCKVDSYLTPGPPGKPLLFVFMTDLLTSLRFFHVVAYVGFPSYLRLTGCSTGGFPAGALRTRCLCREHKRWTHQYLFGILLSILLCIYPEVGLPGSHDNLPLLVSWALGHGAFCLLFSGGVQISIGPQGPPWPWPGRAGSVHLTLTFVWCSGPQSWSQSPWSQHSQCSGWGMRPFTALPTSFHSLGGHFQAFVTFC